MVRKLLMSMVFLAAGFSSALAGEEVVITLPDGSGSREVGVTPSVTDAEGAGPTALTIGDDGVIYVLDQNNGRVLAMDGQRSQAEPEVLALPPDMDGRDLAVVRNTLYLWSDGPVALRKEAGSDGTPARVMRAEGGEADDYTRSVFASMGSQPPGPLNDVVEEIGRSAGPKRGRAEIRQYVPSRGLGDVVATLTFPSDTEAHFALRRESAEDNFLEFSARSSARIGTIEFLDIDATGRPYGLVEILGEGEKAMQGLTVVRFSPDGKPERLYDLPITGDSLPTRRFVAIGPRGDVLFLDSKEARSRVLRLEGRAAPKNGVLALEVRRPDPEPRIKTGPMSSGNVAVIPRNREQVIERAISFEQLAWTVNQASYGGGASCSGMNRLRRPWYLIGMLGRTVKGMPYCWGCKTSPEEFLEGIEDGKVAGNVCTRSDPRREMLGVDCSSFVSETWGLSMHVTTAAMPGITNRLRDPWQLRPGDALNKAGSHVMLVLRLLPDRKVEVMEASPNACRGTVCRNTYTLAALLSRGYKPVRFRGLDG